MEQILSNLHYTIQTKKIRLVFMIANKLYLSLFTLLFFMLFVNKMQACSMYKISDEGKTLVGCNYDTWYTTPVIWFENAESPSEYGAAFNGARKVSNNRTAPNSGMNEVGLMFARLAAYHPRQNDPSLTRKNILNEDKYLPDILHTCSSIEEVKQYIEQYDYTKFKEGITIFIDSTGRYLIVEPYNLVEGDDSYYVLSNFCPSITDDETARKLKRYRHGEDFLKSNEINSSLAFCAAVSDTMSVCRSRNGDGTLLTSIWDTKDKSLNLYFYHSYDTSVQFSLKEELAKGDHVMNIPSLFPRNPEYERLINYRTPFNTPGLRMSLVFLAAFLGLFAFVLGISLFWNPSVSFKNVVFISVLNLLLAVYLIVLATSKNIFYMDAPYQHYSSKLISLSSYLPFVLFLAIIPFTLFTISQLKKVKTKTWIKAILVSNNIAYLMLIVGFAYWGLYSVWN